MKLPKFQYIAPKSTKEASSLLKEHGEKAIAVAGGSDLLVNLKNRLKSPEYLIDLKAIPKLDKVTFSKSEGLTIGAMATLRDLIENPVVRENYPVLVQAAESVGTPQLQYMGTVAGNLCLDNRCYYYNQSPLWHAGRDACFKLGGKVWYDDRREKVLTVSLRYCNVTDGDLIHLSKLTDLRHLELSDTRITDAGLEHLKGLTKLETLDFYNTDVGDAGLELLDVRHPGGADHDF